MYSSSYIWAKVLAYMEEKLSDTVVSAWFEDVEILELTDTKIVFFSPTPFRKDIILRRYSDYVKDAMQELFHTQVEVRVLDETEIDAYRGSKNSSDFIEFNPQFTFESFVVGNSNSMAHAAAMAAAEHPGSVYNPLFIYGQSGLGKTHLLYAIANKIHRDHPDYKIVYIRSDQFTNDLIDAVRNGRNIEFRSKYRSADLFLMDDIQFIAGKDSTQEEFFHTYNTLYEAKKQIVLTADKPPKNMTLLEDRLRTRFESGLLIDIQPPDYNTRMAIIKSKAESLGMNLSNDVCDYIAENVTANVRQIEGTVKKVYAYSMLTKTTMTVEDVTRAIADLRDSANTLPTAGLVIAEVAKFYNLPENVLRGTLKNKNTAEARQVAMYLIRTLVHRSFPEIGQEFGRDHTTAMYSIKKVEQILDDPTAGLRDNIREITANINNRLMEK